MEGGDDVRDGGTNVALLIVGGMRERVELLLEDLIVHLDRLGHTDQLVGRLAQALLAHQALLVELLARAQTRVVDLDIHIGLVAGQANQVAGHVVDLDRLAHVQHEDLAAVGVVAGLEHEAHGLGDGHEIADHAAVRDGHGAVLGDLLLEKRDDRAVGAQDVAETDGRVLRAGGARLRGLLGTAAVHGLDHHLADALGGAHHIGGVHGLVRADQDEAARARLHRDAGYVVGAHHVVLDRLVWAVLHQGHVLVGRGVEDDVGLVLREDLAQAARVAHRADQGLQVQARRAGTELLLDGVGVVLVDVEDDQALGRGLGDLATELGADRPAAARHEDRLVAQGAADLVQVHAPGVAAQQVFDIHRAQGREGGLAVQQLEGAGDHADLAALLVGGLAADVEDLAAVVSRGRGDGEGDQVDAVLLGRAGDLVAAAHDGDRLQVAARLGRVVVDRADGGHAQHAARQHLAHELPARRGAARGEEVLEAAQEAIGEPVRRREAQGEHGAHEIEADGHVGLGDEGDQPHAHLLAAPGAHQARELRDRGEAPDGVVEPEAPHDEEKERDIDGQEARQAVDALRGHVGPDEVEAQEEGQRVGDHDAEGVGHGERRRTDRPRSVVGHARQSRFCVVRAHSENPPPQLSGVA